MSHDAETKVTGAVEDIFAHRFVVRTDTGKVLADLGPEGARQCSLQAGDHVEITGESKPSEFKVSRIAKNGGRIVDVHRGKPHHPGPPHRHEHERADPKIAVQTAVAKGFNVIGDPRRKPHHFEVLGRDKAGSLVELHVEFDGALRKIKPVDDDKPKWAADLKQGASTSSF